MKYLNEVLDKAKKLSSSPTGMALAKKLDVTRSAIANYRHGVSIPKDVTCAKLSLMSEEPYQKMMANIHAQWTVKEDDLKVWRRLAQVASVFIPVLGLTSSFLPSLYIMSSTLCNIFDEIEQLFNISSSRLSRETALPI